MQQPGSIMFGTPLASTSTTTPTFGTASSTFGGFGTSGGTSFGQTAPNTGLKFGTTTTTPSLFGGTSTGTTGGLNFGTTTTPSTGFTFGATSQPQQTGLSFGLQPTTTTATGFSFGTTTTSSAPLGGGLNFGTTGGGTSLTLGGGLTSNFLTKTTASNVITSTPAQTTTSIGLGGVDTFQNKQGQPGSVNKEAEGKAVKENPLPNEFAELIDAFKKHIKDQKMCSSDVARGTIKPLRKISEDIDTLKTSLTEIGNGMITNRQMAERLKFDTAKCLLHAEMAQRIQDTPPGFQIDNSATLQYFVETVNKFENDLSAIRQQIEAIEKHIKSLERPKNLSSQEMTLGLRHLHETFVALAGRLQAIHGQVEMQKEQYLNMRKYLMKDSTDIFDKKSDNDLMKSGGREPIQEPTSSPFTAQKRAAGPTPFSAFGSNTPFSFISQSANNVGNPTTAQPTYPGLGANTLSWGNTNVSAIKTTQPPSYNLSFGQYGGPLFGTSTASSPSNDFQLQKPPTGNKRGKH